MPIMPAICNNCKAFFPFGIVIGGSRVTFLRNTVGPCPKCSSMGYIPDGVFHFMGNEIQIVSAPERTVRALTKYASNKKRIIQILRRLTIR